MEKSRHYLTGVRSDSPADDLPAQAVFDIDEATARSIVRLTEVVRDNGLHTVQKFDYRVTYLQNELEAGEVVDDAESVSTDAECLHVSSNEFWFGGYIKHTGIDVRTDRKPVSELARHFGLNFEVAEL